MVGFISPKTGLPLKANNTFLESSEKERFPIKNGIPRFVDSNNYTAAFGLQWNSHRKTQLDSVTGFSISKERLERCLGFPVNQLKNKKVLEAGCGAGRFTEHLVESGAFIHAFDFSSAVEANRQTVGNSSNYSIAQASIMEIPYPDQSFDVVICLGVLQHTPDPEYSMECLYDKVKPGGLLVIDHYAFSLSMITKLAWAYRFFLKKISPKRSKAIVDSLCAFFFPIHWVVRKQFWLQAVLSRISPCLFYYQKFPFLSKEEHYALTKLDTYDHLTDYYKYLRTANQIKKHLQKLGGVEICVNKGGNGIEARATKKGN